MALYDPKRDANDDSQLSSKDLEESARDTTHDRNIRRDRWGRDRYSALSYLLCLHLLFIELFTIYMMF